MRVIDLEQKSADWLQWRKSGIGGSDAPILVRGEHFRRTVKTLWKEKLDQKSKQATNSAMARGNSLEPVARAMYEQLIGKKVSTLCCVHQDHDWLKASLDGWIPEPYRKPVNAVEASFQRQLEASWEPDLAAVYSDWLQDNGVSPEQAERVRWPGIVVEIKAPKREHHETALLGLPPEEYQPQLDHLLLVTGGRFAHYVSYSNYFEPHEQLAVVKWPRDEKRLEQLFQIEKFFWDHVCSRQEPPSDLSSALSNSLLSS